MGLRNISWLLGFFVLFYSVVGLSGPNHNAAVELLDGEVFEFVPASQPALPAFQLLDRSAASRQVHSIARRDTTGSGSPELTEDNHIYYKLVAAKSHPLSVYYTSEFDRIFSTYPTRSNLNLNNGRNLALTIELTFPFDFYGHTVKSVVLTTGGFIYVNDLSHPYLTFSQYIAPMMADFETRGSVSSIKFVEIEDAFWVRWENLFVSSNSSLGNFSFQCAMFANGSIVFDYISIPINMDQLRSASSVLRIGLSDAFYYDIRGPTMVVSAGTVLRRIVKYHELNVPRDKVVTDGIIQLVHLPTCNQQSSCLNCTDRARVPGFNCSWCYELGRCSSGVDRQTQNWHDSECHYKFTRFCWRDTTTRSAGTTAAATVEMSTSTTSSSTAAAAAAISTATSKNPGVDVRENGCTGGSCNDGSGVPMGRHGTESLAESMSQANSGQVALGICLGLLVLALVAAVAGVLLYGYRHPGSGIGLWLIEHRPSRIRERFFGGGGGAGGGGGCDASSSSGGGGGGVSYKVGSENPYDNFSNI